VPHAGGATVLLVEDEMLVRRTVQAMLESLGYRVVPAADAAEAIRVFETRAGQVDLLLTDLVMPGLSGRDLADGLRQVRPDLAVLFMSGHTDSPPAHGPGTGFLQKPFTPAMLGASVHEVLSRTASKPRS
jgi:CheY-like chemotaxis protein